MFYSPLGRVWRAETHSGTPFTFYPIVTFTLLFYFISHGAILL